jgi:hypothetical protein
VGNAGQLLGEDLPRRQHQARCNEPAGLDCPLVSRVATKPAQVVFDFSSHSTERKKIFFRSEIFATRGPKNGMSAREIVLKTQQAMQKQVEKHV